MANGKKLVSYTGTEKNVVVPTAVGGTLVREIASDAFEGTDVLTVVVDTYANDINVSQLQDVQVVWNKEPKCAITFDANGGSGSMDSQIANIGIAFTLPECEFTAPSGKQFKNWLIGSTQVNAGAQYAFSGSTEVKANWESVPVASMFIALATAPSDNGTGGAKSLDGSTWVASNIGDADGIANRLGCCYGDGKFVALPLYGPAYDDPDYKGRITTDGVTWSDVQFPSWDWKSICYGDSRFVAAGSKGYITYSTDGINWSAASLITSYASDDGYASKICYGDGKYVVCGSKKHIYTSTDLSNWTKIILSSPLSTSADFIYYGNGKFIIMNTCAEVRYSSDGITWSVGNIPEEHSGGSYCGCYGNGKFIAIGFDEDEWSNTLLCSTDGINWSSSMLSDCGLENPRKVCYGNGKFICIDANTCSTITSTNGTTWAEGGSLPYIYYDDGEDQYEVGYTVICSTN